MARRNASTHHSEAISVANFVRGRLNATVNESGGVGSRLSLVPQ